MLCNVSAYHHHHHHHLGFVQGWAQGSFVEAEARQGSNVLNRVEARQRQRARGRGEAD